MRIAILSPSDRTYINKFIPQYSQDELPKGYPGAAWAGPMIDELLKKNHEVIAITTTDAIKGDYSVKMFAHDNFKWVTVPSRPHAFKMNGLKSGRVLDFYAFERKKMLNVIETCKPDIVHAFWTYEFAAAALKSKVPSLVTIHDNPYKVLSFFKNTYRFFRLLMSEWVMSQVKFVSTVSPYMLDYAKKRCKEVKIIPNPVVITLDSNEVEILIEKKIETIKSPKFVMINNGWNLRKNGMCGLIAFQSILNDYPDASLHLFGADSEIGGKAFKDAESIDLKGVNFHGVVSHDFLVEELKTAHILIHPALEESFGVVLIEAMSFGIPAIGGDKSGGVPWVINDTNLLVDVTDPNVIKNKIEELLQDTDLYKKTAESCYRNTVDRFSASFVTEEYLKYYDTILNQN